MPELPSATVDLSQDDIAAANDGFFSNFDLNDALGLGITGAGLFLGADQQQQGASNLRDLSQFRPPNIFSQFGSSIFDPASNSFVAAGDNPFQQRLTDLSTNILDQLNAAENPQDLLSKKLRRRADQADKQLGLGIGQANRFGRQAFGSAQDVLSAFQNFDNDQFAQDRFNELDSLARPFEDRLQNKTVSKLFSTGRSGTSGGRREFGDFLQNLDNAQTQRALTARQFAGQEQGRLAGLAGSLFNQGVGARNFGAQRGLERFNLAQSTFDAGNNQRNNLLNQFTSAFAPIQGINNELLNLINLSSTAGGAQSAANFNANLPLQQISNQRGDDIANIFSQFAGGLQ